MKILFYASYPNISIGYSRIANKLTNYLAEQGHIIYYFGISNFKNGPIVERYIHPNIILIDALEEESKIGNCNEHYGVNSIWNKCVEINPECVFIYNDIIVISRILNTFRERNMVKTFHLCIYLDLVYPFEKIKLIKHINSYSDTIMVFSDCWRENLIQMNVPPNKIKILYHGFDSNTFFKMDTLEARKYFHLNENDFVILNSNRNSYRKQLDKTIDVFTLFLKLKNKDSRIKLFLNTNTNESDVNVSYDILNQIEISCIKNNLDYKHVINNHIFINGNSNAYSDEVLNYLYNACDIGINTCIGEGFGLCNLEHGGVGKPQIVSGVGGLVDIFKPEWSVIAIPVEEYYIPNHTDLHGGFAQICLTTDYVDGLVRYFDNYSLQHDHGEKMSNIILNKYNWENVFRTLNMLIHDMDPRNAQFYMGLKYHMEEAYNELNIIPTPICCPNPPVALFSHTYHNEINKLLGDKIVDFCFIGSIQSCYHMRKWVIDFATKYFTSNSIFVNTDYTNDWISLGSFDYSSKMLGFCPKNNNDNQSKHVQFRIVEENVFYFQTMKQSKFVLCPAGDADWSFRFYEVLMCKSLPIVELKKHTYRTTEESQFQYEHLLSTDIHDINNIMNDEIKYNELINKNSTLFELHHKLTHKLKNEIII